MTSTRRAPLKLVRRAVSDSRTRLIAGPAGGPHCRPALVRRPEDLHSSAALLLNGSRAPASPTFARGHRLLPERGPGLRTARFRALRHEQRWRGTGQPVTDQTGIAYRDERAPVNCGADGMKPLLLGFQSVLDSSTPAVLNAGLHTMAVFVQREGYAMGQVFLVAGTTCVLTVVNALSEAVKRDGVAAVAVPTAADLGRTRQEQHVMRELIQRVAGVPLRIVELAS
jgi:hypothetical protein